MRHALSLGRRGLGKTWPNPNVGCVVVADGRVVGRGWTAPGGRPHAETQALAQAGALARGATAYVTLEPCAHHGQTPPCAQALIAAGVARVVIASRDPDPRVAGRGIDMLRAAGIAVETGICEAEARRDLAGFLNRIELGRPMVTLKLATTLDGRIATASGESQWITGPGARRMVHAMRAEHDAVMVGGGTARADDPMLTVRGMGDVAQPVRVVLSRRLDLRLDGQLAKSARDVPLWLVHGRDAEPGIIEAWQGLGAKTLECPSGPDRQIDAGAALALLGGEGLTRVFCEGGGMLAASLLAGGLADRLVQFSAGMAMGAEGRPGLGAMGIDRLADAPRFDLERMARVGPDLMAIWRRG